MPDNVIDRREEEAERFALRAEPAEKVPRRRLLPRDDIVADPRTAADGRLLGLADLLRDRALFLGRQAGLAAKVLASVLDEIATGPGADVLATNAELAEAGSLTLAQVRAGLDVLEQARWIARVACAAHVSGRAILRRWTTANAAAPEPQQLGDPLLLLTAPPAPPGAPPARQAATPCAPGRTPCAPGAQASRARGSSLPVNVEEEKFKALTRHAPDLQRERRTAESEAELRAWLSSEDAILRSIAAKALGEDARPAETPQEAATDPTAATAPAPPEETPPEPPAAPAPPEGAAGPSYLAVPEGRRRKTTELLAALGEHRDAGLVPIVARRLCEDFRDTKSERKFLKECHALRRGDWSLGEMLDAYQAAMSPGVRKRGAVFVRVLEGAQKAAPGATRQCPPGAATHRHPGRLSNRTQGVAS